MNRDQETARCLESLKHQTDKDFEVIVVDQSKNRRTKTVCRPYNLKYYRPKKRKNLAHARNFGVNMAAGEVLAFIDDDSEANEIWVEEIKKNYAVAQPPMLAGKVINTSDANNNIMQFQNGIVSKSGEFKDLLPVSELKYHRGYKGWYSYPFGTNAIFLKKEILKSGGFDEYYDFFYEEADIALRIIKNGGECIYDDSLIVNHHNARSRKGSLKTNWRELTKNSIYFGLKNGGGWSPLTLFRTFWRLFSSKGPYRLALNQFLRRKLNPFRLFYNWFFINIGATQGIYGGLFSPRKLIRKFESPGKFVLFTKRANV
jgi:hypothetical protein